MAEGCDSVDSGRKLSVGWRNNIPDVSSLYLGSDEVEQVLCREHSQELSVGWRNNIPDVSSLYLGSDEVEQVLCREHSQELKYFCQGHMAELCITCRTMEHRNCKTVIDIKEAAENIYSEVHGKKIIQSVKCLVEQFKDFKAIAEHLKSKLKQARKCIADYLDKFEGNAVADIDRNLKDEIRAEKQICICEVSLSSLSINSSETDRTMSRGNKEEKFIAINIVTKQTKQYCKLLVEMYRELSELGVKFEFLDVCHILGTVSVETSQFTDVFIESTPIYTGEMRLKRNTGDEPPVVTTFDVLQDGRMLVLDYNNAKIQLYDKDNIFLTETVLPVKEDEICLSVVVNTSTEALVSTHDGRLFKVIISSDLAVSEIKTKYKVLSMTKYGKDILCILDNNEQFKLCVIDMSMRKIIKTIQKDNGTLFRVPFFIGVAADKNTIYVLDRREGCYGITSNAEIVFHYQNPDAVMYRGLVIDSDGLFIGARVGSKYQVEKLNFSGKRQEVCTIFGNSWPLGIVENEFILFQYDDNDTPCVRFYCLLK